MLRFREEEKKKEEKEKACLVIQFVPVYQKRIRGFQRQTARGKSISATISL